MQKSVSLPRPMKTAQKASLFKGLVPTVASPGRADRRVPSRTSCETKNSFADEHVF